MEDKVRELDTVNSKESMSLIIDQFRILASNNRNNNYILDTLDRAVQRCKQLNDQKSLVKLYEIKISQIEHIKERHQDIVQLVQQMKEISERIKYKEGLALAYYKEWYIEKFRGNKEKSKKALDISKEYISQETDMEQYVYYVCNYSYGVEKWLTEHDIETSIILEECSEFFYKNGYYRSFAQTLAILTIIYVTMQNGNRILDKCRKIFENKDFFEKLPTDVKGISYYLTGLGYMMNMNLEFAESLFQKSFDILKPIHKESIYFSNYIVLHSHMITVKALQGKIEQTWKLIREVEELLGQDFFIKNLDSSTNKQIKHTLNLNKFYVYSRLKDFDSKEMQDLIEEIFEGSTTSYSNFMLLSEYILNSNIAPDKLKELLSTDNYCINRVKHIISFKLLSRTKEDRDYKLAQKRIEVLINREKTETTTFTENVFADLLIAQQLFSLTRYGDIYPLLLKYKNQLNRIEVLEMRLFMEAFIQVGAYKTGDPLGPALQYMAIKKCRQYGFSRLENKLLDYLAIQGNDALRVIM